MDVQKYFDNFFKGSKEPLLDAMQYFMKKYNNFQNEMKFIHIAGTNGKGSCVEMLSNILVQQGYKVGKFISPHLITYNERISINGKLISDNEMEDLIKELEPEIEEYNKNKKMNVTFFELITVMALLYFYRNKVDFVVLETGLGGLYDCTNVIANPLVSVITSIGYDHMHILGETLTEIAIQKAGIIKENSNTVFFAQTDEINNVFRKICIEKNNKFHLVTDNDIENYMYDSDYQYFDYKEYKEIPVVLKGQKQIQNATLCLQTVNILNQLGYIVSEKSIKNGLKTVVHKGRMEVINQSPLVIYDGAHNEPAMKNLQSMVKMYYDDVKRTYIVSILKRKDYKKMVQILLEDENAKFIFTSGNDSERYVSKEELYEIASNLRKKQKIFVMELNEAIETTIKESMLEANLSKENKTKNVCFIVGSFYVYKTVINQITKTL